jgi:hypothetical membrane protein
MPLAAYAGIAGPALFTLVVLLLGWLQPDYHPWVQSVDAISIGRMGTLMDVTLFVFGILMGVFTVALYRGVRPGPGSLTGLASLMLSSIGIVLTGIFPMTTDIDGAIVQTTGHALASTVAYLGAAIGFYSLAGLLAADPPWSRLANMTRKSGQAMLWLFPAILGTMPVWSPFHLGVGVLQRLALVIWFTCTIMLSLKLRHVLDTLEFNREDDRDLVLS